MARPRIHIISCVQDSRQSISNAAEELAPDAEVACHENNDDFLEYAKTSDSAAWEIVVTDLIKISMPVDNAKKYKPVIHFVDDCDSGDDINSNKPSFRQRHRILVHDIKDHLEEAIASANLFIKLQSGVDKFSQLDSRERSVVMLAAEGVPNKIISRKINVSIKTVEHCRRKAYQKLGVKTSAEVASLVTFEKFFSVLEYPMQINDAPTLMN